MSAVLNQQVRENRKQRVRSFMQGLSSAETVDVPARILELQQKISQYEKRYSMSTLQMEEAICSGQLKPVGEIDDWSTCSRILMAFQEHGKA